MEVTVHLDGNPAVREEGFFESKVTTLENQIKALEFELSLIHISEPTRL